MSKKEERIIVNQFCVTGEVIDIINFDEFNLGKPNECWKYTLRIETDPETGETHDVEYFTTVSNEKKNESMTTIYEGVKTRVKDEVGTIVRCTGVVSSNDYYKDGELVKKPVLSGSFCNRKDGSGSSKYSFEPCATFKVTALVKEVIEEDGKIILDTLLNEYKSKNGKIKGSYIDFEISEEVGKKGLSKMIEKTKNLNDDFILMPLSGILKKEIEIIEVDENELIEESTEDAWGDFEEEIEKSNERKRKLKEEGIRREKLVLELKGAKVGLSKDKVEEKELPFSDYDIKDMIDAVEHALDDSKARDDEKRSKEIKDSEVPF